ncbi:MAG: DMT family transporter [Candidatus Rokuibacteriota bacterium]
MTLSSDAALGAIAALGSACTWAVTSLLVRRLAPTLTSLMVNALRSVLGGALLLAWVLLRSGSDDLTSVSPQAFLLLVVSIVIAVGVGDTLFFESARRLGIARAMTLSMTYPLIATLLAAATFGEAVTPSFLAGSVVTLAGLALIVMARDGHGERDPGQVRAGVTEATIASVAWAVSVIVLKYPLAEMDATSAQAIRLPVGGLLLWATPWAWPAAARVRAGGRSVQATLACLSVLTAVSSVMFVVGVKHAGVAVTTVLSSTAPMFAIPLGMIFLGERLSVAGVLGTVVTVAGIAILQR